MGPTLIGYLIQGSLKYGWYEIFKPMAAAFLAAEGVSSDGGGKLLSFMIAGACAELIGSSFLCPFEAARIRMVVNPGFAPGAVSCIKKIIDEESVGSLFKGLPAILAKQIPYTVVQLSTFEFLTSSVYQYLSSIDIDSGEIGQYKYLISASAALVAAVLSSLASQPGDSLLSAVNKSARSAKIVNAEGVQVTQGTLELMAATVKELGPRGLFKGTKARLLHMITIVVTQLLVYDFIKQLCGIAATGAH
jgi:solute carrier family 25 phosphate transporter 3